MIEIIYKEEDPKDQEQERTFSLPRNIRQIGQVGENHKIYIEDYVYTFLVRLSRAQEDAQEQKGRTAVLTGETKQCAGVSYLFIKGAILTEDEEATTEHIDFSEEIWKKVYEDQERFFEGQEIVGWFFTRQQLPLEITELFTKVHLKHFGGEKVLMLMEPLEREDAFFYYENNSMMRMEGYYIYYEKNPGMQEYMLEKNAILQPVGTESCKDDAVKNFRKIIAEKNEEKQEKEIPPMMSYAVTVCLAAAVLMVGINFYRNYQELSKEEESKAASSVIVEEVTPVITQKEQKSIQREKTENTEGSTKSDKKKQKDETAEKNTENSDGEKDSKKNGENAASQNQNEETQADADSHAEDTDENTDTEKEVEASAPDSTADQTQQMPEETAQIYQEESDVRKAQKRAREAAEKENAQAVSAAHESYVIQPGDTLFQISMERYGNIEKIREICELNHLSVDQIIYPGQVIVLP